MKSFEFFDMDDKKKTKVQLIKEIASLRKQLKAKEKTLATDKLEIKDISGTKEYIEAIVQASNDGIFVVDEDGRFEYGNKASFKIFEWPKKEVIGHNFIKFIPPDLHEPTLQRWKEVQNGAEGPHKTAILTKKGKRKDVFVNHRRAMISGRRRYCIVIRDVTGIKKAERQSKQFGQIIEDSLNEIYIFDADTFKFIHVNEGARKNLGYTQAELSKLTPYDLKPKFTKRSFKDLVSPLLLGKQKTIRFETMHKRKDGSLYPVQIHLQYYSTSDPAFFAAIVLDITEQKKIQAKFEKSEARYRILYESAQDAILIVDKQMNCISGNPSAVRLFGCKDEKDLFFKTPLDFSPEFQPDGYSSLSKIQEYVKKMEEQGSVSFEWQHRLADGSEFPGLVLLTTMELEGQTVMLSTVRDITEQKRAQNAIKNLLDFENLVTEVSTSFINLPAEQTDMGIRVALGVLSRFLGVDRSYIALFSEDQKKADIAYEWRDKNVSSLEHMVVDCPAKGCKWWMGKLKNWLTIHLTSIDDFPKGAAKEKRFFQAAKVKSFVSVPMFFSQKLIGYMVFDSVRTQKSWDEETISLLRTIAEIFVNTIMRSRTQRELREYHEKMFRTEQLASLGTISANIAHELNQPITVIQLLLQQSRRSLNSKTKDLSLLRENIEDSLDEISKAAEIVGRFRTFARQSSPSSIESIDICKITQKLIGVLKSAAKKAKLNLSLTAPEKPVLILANTAEIEQLFFVIIQNSIQAADEKIINNLKIKVYKKKDEVCLEFEDDCGGVDPEIEDMIFRPFFTTKPRQMGTGLGLSILQRIVERYDGSVDYENKPGSGISFIISLPTKS
jgi:PAS domain S-box-containing protein